MAIPVVLAAAGLWFTAQQDQRQVAIENQRAEAERELAEQRAQDEALQAYLDQMSTLLLAKDLRNSEPDSEVRTLARARMVTVIQRLDADGNRNVIRFLNEARLTGIGQSSMSLLAGADLQGARLEGADLSDADLSEADLRYADLSYTHLYNADLRYANLYDADLSETYLLDASLSETYLRGADLSDAVGVTKEDLEQGASDLGDATMPDGSKHP